MENGCIWETLPLLSKPSKRGRLKGYTALPNCTSLSFKGKLLLKNLLQGKAILLLLQEVFNKIKYPSFLESYYGCACSLFLGFCHFLQKEKREMACRIVWSDA